MAEVKERAAFTLSQSVKTELEATIPKTKRSQFVDQAIAEALRLEAKKRALEALDNPPKYDAASNEDSVEVLRRLRAERTKYLVERHKPLRA